MRGRSIISARPSAQRMTSSSNAGRCRSPDVSERSAIMSPRDGLTKDASVDPMERNCFCQVCSGTCAG